MWVRTFEDQGISPAPQWNSEYTGEIRGHLTSWMKTKKSVFISLSLHFRAFVDNLV